ncbi:hypothetical protein [Desulfurobacterium indicum]|uniref:Uncharacterized protein n=1 Tax=Desulfurobacterium indicum TaxID=1914305 RepID=A0A1R1MMW5_9BACT|nr:hypothetical protein [Desulfurobacterium indicum]OMH41155.1 hypothetical protein BLW93_01310 [Desulfurobacterium indicum]
MDAGIMTTIVAGVFGAIGIVIGFIIGKLSSKPAKDYTPVLREFETIVKSLQDKVNRLIDTVSSSTKEILDEQKTNIKVILDEIEKLKVNLEESGLSIKSAETLNDVISELNNLLDASLPSTVFDQQLITKIKDKVDIIRAEVEAIKLSLEENKKKKEESKTQPIDVDKIKEALNMAKEINEEAVKGDLISLMYAFKEDDKKDLLKSIDEIALNSKQLVLILEDLIKLVKEREIK